MQIRYWQPNIMNNKEQITATDGKPLVVGSALPPQYCIDCKNHPEPKNFTYENHLKCKHCVFIGNQQSNFEPKSV